MKKLFIIFFLFSATCFSQIKKDSIRRLDSIKKVELKNNIASLQLKLDSILKNEQKEKKEAPEEWTVNGRVNFIFNQTSFSNWLAGGENNVAGNIGVNYDFNYRNKKWKWDNKIISSFGITHANESCTSEDEIMALKLL